MFVFCIPSTQGKKEDLIDPEIEESKVKSLCCTFSVPKLKSYVKKESKAINVQLTHVFIKQAEDDHHFRKPANDITSQLEINFGDLGRPSRGRGGPRGGRGGGGRGRGEVPRPVRGGRTDKVKSVTVVSLCAFKILILVMPKVNNGSVFLLNVSLSPFFVDSTSS